LVGITGDYGCPKRFWYEQNDPASHDADFTSSGRAVLGTATHEAIAAGLGTHADARAFIHDYMSRAGSLRWRDDDASLDKLVDERAHMVMGAVATLYRRAARVIALESGFIVRLGEYWFSGHVDCIYEPRGQPGAIAMCDWKTSAAKPHPIELDHGWEGGIYALALSAGMFFTVLPGESRAEFEARMIAFAKSRPGAGAGTRSELGFAPTHGQYPVAAHHVHLGDFVPYLRAGTKYVTRAEDLAHWGYGAPTDHKYVKGELRGGGWCRVGVGEHDVPRLYARVRAVVGMVRMGRFFDRPDEKCTRCAYARACLTDGYQSLETPEQRRAETALAQLQGSNTHDDGTGNINHSRR
jgi:hypothetical protein